ncbi:MAG: ABC transporter permease, partial [Bacillota bacterium]
MSDTLRIRPGGAMGRVLTYAVTLWAVVTLNFLLPRLLPGDPFLWLSGEAGEEVAVLTEEQHRVLMAQYGLDRPLPEQYRRYLAGLARGDLGFSIYYREPVAALVGRRLPWSLLVVGGATLLSLGGGVALGAASVWRRGRLLDRSLLVGLLVVGEIPAFLVGMVLLVG